MKYLDDYHVLVNGKDVTNFTSDLTLEDSLNSVSVTFSFTVFISQWDKYVKNLHIAPGDKVSFKNNGDELFSGRVAVVGLDGLVTAYDNGRYLNKSEVILQCSAARADDAIRQLCGKAGVKPGDIAELATRIDNLWVGSTPASILTEILEICTAETGKKYRYRIENGALNVKELTNEPIIAWHKPAANLAPFNITWALGQVSGEDSAEDLYNAVVIAAEDDGKVYVGAQAFNTESQRLHGSLQHIETVSSNPGRASLELMAKNLLNEYDRITHTRTIEEIWGADEVKSGVVLSFNSPAFGIKGLHRVTHVVHNYGNAGHTMQLELEALEQPRAAQDSAWMKGEDIPPATDNVQVFGLPDSFGAEAELGSGKDISGMALVGGKSVKALFTAYYPANNAKEGGLKDSMGNWLNPANKTCAAPVSIPFGTKITIQGTGTSRDGETYTVTDRGEAITVSNGVYHFDLLMRTSAECNNWGRRYGTAIIGGTWKNTGSVNTVSVSANTAADFIAVAKAEIGYEEYGKNMTKYGEWSGNNGVSWCVIFVCWCSSKAGAPIPTNYAAVSDMANYFKGKGLYKAVSTGYTPKPGDLMIQGSRHIGIVESATRAEVHTIEGNVSNRVSRMVRSYSEISGFCTPWK